MNYPHLASIGINNTVYKVNETEFFFTDVIERMLQEDEDITYVAVVHCETTTGILNPIEEVCCIAKRYNKMTIVDAMSSFGGIPMDIEQLQIDLLISSSNKCIQGVPGFGFVIAKSPRIFPLWKLLYYQRSCMPGQPSLLFVH